MFDIDRAVDENMEGLVRDIKRLVAHYSVQGEPSEGKPFGDGPAGAVAEAFYGGVPEAIVQSVWPLLPVDVQQIIIGFSSRFRPC